jgi:hypothetical protein
MAEQEPTVEQLMEKLDTLMKKQKANPVEIQHIIKAELGL